ncbi:MAG: hypothetical protein ACI31D_06725, partial [Candidatus Limisoma sp.]
IANVAKNREILHRQDKDFIFSLSENAPFVLPLLPLTSYLLPLTQLQNNCLFFSVLINCSLNLQNDKNI